MIYYTKDGKPTFVPQTDEDRFNIWVEKISDWRLITTKQGVKVVGSGIAEPNEAELAWVYGKPCHYRRAARASRA